MKCCKYPNLWWTFTNGYTKLYCKSCGKEVIVYGKFIDPFTDKKSIRHVKRLWKKMIKGHYRSVTYMEG